MIMHKFKLILFACAACAFLVACQWQAPTSSSNDGKISLALNFAQWQEYAGDDGQRLSRAQNLAAITRVEIYVLFDKDTLAHTIAPVSESGEFSAALEVPIGTERRVIVEAWDDRNGDGNPVRTFRGVQTGIEVQPNLAQEVEVTLYPVPIAGQNVVLIIGNGQGAPGTSNNLVPITLISADSLSGMQFDLNYDANLIAPVAAQRNNTMAFDTLTTNVIFSEQGQALRALFFSTTGKRLPALLDPTVIASVAFQVNEAATAGETSPLQLSNLTVLDQQQQRLSVLAVEGSTFVVVGK